jgi:D-sedoheptulose 7-phosphate isomerase
MFRKFAEQYLAGVADCLREVPLDRLERIVDAVVDAHAHGRTLYVFGNGGSASAASHIACDWGKGTSVPGKPRLRIVSLSDNIALITAWANDFGYELVFREQLVNLLEPGDVVLGLTASGNSPNVLRAMEYAKDRGAVTIGFIGFGGGKLKEIVDLDITVSSRNYGQVEEIQMTLNHVISQYLKERFQSS